MTSVDRPVTSEPVRGGFPDPGFGNLPGLERARAYQRGLVPRPPLWHLTGLRLTQVGPGSATCTMPASPWLTDGLGFVPIEIPSVSAITMAQLTAAPPGFHHVASVISADGIIMADLAVERVVARARVVHSGRTFTMTEVTTEDIHGRLLGRGMMTSRLVPIDPPPPPAPALEPVEEPTYASPDPHARAAPDQGGVGLMDDRSGAEFLAAVSERSIRPPNDLLLGLRATLLGEGRLDTPVTASPWLCEFPHVQEGVLYWLGRTMSGGAAMWFVPPKHYIPGFGQTLTILRTVPPDGRELLVRGTAHQRAEDIVPSHAEIQDADGNLVAIFRQTSMIIPVQTGPTARRERRLVTVLYTDIVSSTEQTAQRGDGEWHDLLEKHHAAVRAKLTAHQGREIKTTGDGFLATFETPAEAVRCADAIRSSVGSLGLQTYAGLHTGEVEFSSGDITGIAAVIAKRVQDLAEPGEILVSSTVRDLVEGSGLTFSERGAHDLKGIDGTRELFALA